jgi:tRNA pseudouridine synthase 10
LKKLEKRINLYSEGMVEVMDLRPSTKDEVVAIKNAKVLKSYNVEVEFDKPVNQEKLNEVVSAFKDKEIEQKTPKRVMHRRADKVRKRKVVDIGIESVDKKGVKFTITGESGIYIKELIHGDEGSENGGTKKW